MRKRFKVSISVISGRTNLEYFALGMDSASGLFSSSQVDLRSEAARFTSLESYSKVCPFSSACSRS